jgi:RNA polymerase sigma-70 factor (ECF subfamily)
VLHGEPEAALAGVLPTEERKDETALIRAAQQGDQGAFEQLVMAYDQAVLRLAYNLVRSEEDAGEIYQEAFLRVFRSLPGFRFESSFPTWLYRIVTNLCMDHLRKRAARRERSGAIELEDGCWNRLEAVPDARADGDPQRALMGQELAHRIERGLSELTPRERMVFELRHYEGLRLRAIGEIMGTSEEAAKNCLFRASQKLRLALGDLA